MGNTKQGQISPNVVDCGQTRENRDELGQTGPNKVKGGQKRPHKVKMRSTKRVKWGQMGHTGPNGAKQAKIGSNRFKWNKNRLIGSNRVNPDQTVPEAGRHENILKYHQLFLIGYCFSHNPQSNILSPFLLSHIPVPVLV